MLGGCKSVNTKSERGTNQEQIHHKNPITLSDKINFEPNNSVQYLLSIVLRWMCNVSWLKKYTILSLCGSCLIATNYNIWKQKQQQW